MKAECGQKVVRYEVVEASRFSYLVVEICDDSYRVGNPRGLLMACPRHLVRSYVRQEKAIEHADGLASGTWSVRGPIRYAVLPVDVEEAA